MVTTSTAGAGTAKHGRATNAAESNGEGMGRQTADMAAIVTDQLLGGTHELIEKVQVPITQLVFTSAHVLAERVHVPLAAVVLDRAVPVVKEVAKAHGDLAAVWSEFMRDQLAFNVRTLRLLAEAREWRDVISIQCEFLAETNKRSGECMSRQMDFAGVLGRALAIEIKESKTAA